MNNNKSKTWDNLAKSYVGESCARNRYDMLAKLAESEGYVCMSDMLKIVATNEFNHARMMFSFLDALEPDEIKNINICSGYPFKQKLNSLQENLRLSAEDETNESVKIYPQFATVAREEGFEDIAKFFDNLVNVENCHKMLLTQLYTQLKDGTLYKKQVPTKWKCSGCGHEDTTKAAWKKCPLCQAPQGTVMIKIEDNA